MAYLKELSRSPRCLAPLLLLGGAAGYLANSRPTNSLPHAGGTQGYQRHRTTSLAVLAMHSSSGRSSRRIGSTDSDHKYCKYSPYSERDDVVENPSTFRTVAQLNELSLASFRCHSIASDTAPKVDPFGLVADDIASLSVRPWPRLARNRPLTGSPTAELAQPARPRCRRRTCATSWSARTRR